MLRRPCRTGRMCWRPIEKRQVAALGVDGLGGTTRTMSFLLRLD